MDFATRLKELRKEYELNQDRLAEIAEVSKSSISMYENGNRIPELETFEKLADYFNVDMDYLKGKTSIRRNEGEILIVGEEDSYYLNDETRRIAQEIYDNQDLRILFDASKDAKPEDLKFVADMMMRLKGDNTM